MKTMAYVAPRYRDTYLALMPYDIQDIINKMVHTLILKEDVLPCLLMEILNDIPDPSVLIYEYSTLYTQLLHQIVDYLSYYSEKGGGVVLHFDKLIHIMVLKHYAIYAYPELTDAIILYINMRDVLTAEGSSYYSYFNMHLDEVLISNNDLTQIERNLHIFTYMELLAFNNIVKNDMVDTMCADAFW